MTRRSDKQAALAFMVPDKPDLSVWAVGDYCSDGCNADGTNIVALFDSKQTASQFAEARGYPTIQRMLIYRAMKRAD